MKLIKQGAEANIYLDGNSILKERVKKGYRIDQLDKKIRKQNTRNEIRNLERASKIINVPKVLKTDEKQFKIWMENIDGQLVKDIVNKKNYLHLAKLIGTSIDKLHKANIIHGDLTTSNMILKDDKIFFIDFGLSYHSLRKEDKAVDLRLLRQAIEAKHYDLNNFFEKILDSYIYNEVKDHLKIVEKRGRYKNKH